MSMEELINAIGNQESEKVKDLLKQDFVKNLSMDCKKIVIKAALFAQNSNISNEIFLEIANNRNFLSNFNDTLEITNYIADEVNSINDNDPNKLGYYSRWNALKLKIDDMNRQINNGVKGIIPSIGGIFFGAIAIYAALTSAFLIIPPIALVITGVAMCTLGAYGLVASSYSVYQVNYNNRLSSHTENATLGLIKSDAPKLELGPIIKITPRGNDSILVEKF